MAKPSRNPNARRAYEFIKAHRREYPIEVMCRVLTGLSQPGRKFRRILHRRAGKFLNVKVGGRPGAVGTDLGSGGVGDGSLRSRPNVSKVSSPI